MVLGDRSSLAMATAPRLIASSINVFPSAFAPCNAKKSEPGRTVRESQATWQISSLLLLAPAGRDVSTLLNTLHIDCPKKSGTCMSPPSSTPTVTAGTGLLPSLELVAADFAGGWSDCSEKSAGVKSSRTELSDTSRFLYAA